MVRTGYGRFAAVAERLARSGLRPLGASEMARELDITKQQAFDALRHLKSVGWAEQLDGGLWRLSPHLTMISRSFERAIADTHELYLGPPAAKRCVRGPNTDSD